MQSQHKEMGGGLSESCCCSVAQSLCHVWLFVTPWTSAHQASSPSPSAVVCSSSCSLSQWCHPTISSSVIPLSPFPQSFPASGSFPMSPLFASGGQSIGASALASVLPMHIQDWFPLGWTGWISLQSKGLPRSSLTPQFKGINSSTLSQSSFWSNPNIHTWLLEKP